MIDIETQASTLCLRMIRYNKFTSLIRCRVNQKQNGYLSTSNHRFAFAVNFNLKRRIGAIRRPNMGNVINLCVEVWAAPTARLRAAVDPTVAGRGTYSRIQLSSVTSSACVDGGVCLPRGIRCLLEFERHLSLQRCVSTHVLHLPRRLKHHVLLCRKLWHYQSSHITVFNWYRYL